MAYGTVNADVIGTSVANSNLGAGNATRFKNRIINGDMRIDQRNSGASINAADNTYCLDRWYMQNYPSANGVKYTVQQNAGSVTPPAGFNKYLGITSSSAYTLASDSIYNIAQYIEGFNFADLGWGTADAKTVTLSFWVRSSLTGTFGGVFSNSAFNYSYPYTYTISSANTWEQKTITISGPTAGTWVGATNGVGVRVLFSLGTGTTFSGAAGSWASADYRAPTGATSVVGTNGATFYITGVQLEVGSSATGFEYVDMTAQTAMCQRYFEKSYSISTAVGTAVQAGGTSIYAQGSNFTDYAAMSFYRTTKRTAPTVTIYNPSSGASGSVQDYQNNAARTATVYNSGEGGFGVYWGRTSSGVNDQYQWAATAEL